MKAFETVSRGAPGAQTCLGCMGKGYHVVRMPSRYGTGMVNEQPVCPKCNGTGAVMGDRPPHRVSLAGIQACDCNCRPHKSYCATRLARVA